jgi:hypothetical protein
MVEGACLRADFERTTNETDQGYPSKTAQSRFRGVARASAQGDRVRGRDSCSSYGEWVRISRGKPVVKRKGAAGTRSG